MNSQRSTDAANATGRSEALDEQLDALPRRRSGGFDQDGQVGQDAPPAWVKLHELLRMPDVAVPPSFADNVMARLQASDALPQSEQNAQSRRVSAWSLAAAFLGAATLLALVVGLGADSGQPSILATVVSGFATAALAGAGLVGATWTGVGTTVGAWLGTSATAGASLAFAALASAGALGWSLRRRAIRQRD